MSKVHRQISYAKDGSDGSLPYIQCTMMFRKSRAPVMKAWKMFNKRGGSRRFSKRGATQVSSLFAHKVR